MFPCLYSIICKKKLLYLPSMWVNTSSSSFSCDKQVDTGVGSLSSFLISLSISASDSILTFCLEAEDVLASSSTRDKSSSKTAINPKKPYISYRIITSNREFWCHKSTRINTSHISIRTCLWKGWISIPTRFSKTNYMAFPILCSLTFWLLYRVQYALTLEC